MLNIVKWTSSLDLTDFYNTAEKKGFLNNASQRMLVDCFRNEREKEIWILYNDDKAIGSVAAHSFDEMGSDSYRIAVRTCVFTDQLPIRNLRTMTGIVTHQNVTAQILIPTCIEWAGRDKKLYITSNELSAGSQRLVHKIFFPALEKTGQVIKIGELDYRGTRQVVWQLIVENFYKNLEKNLWKI
jgi:hypothetical protein